MKEEDWSQRGTIKSTLLSHIELRYLHKIFFADPALADAGVLISMATITSVYSVIFTSTHRAHL